MSAIDELVGSRSPTKQSSVGSSSKNAIDALISKQPQQEKKQSIAPIGLSVDLFGKTAVSTTSGAPPEKSKFAPQEGPEFRQTPPQNIFQQAGEFISRVWKKSPEDRVAFDQNVYAISKTTGADPDVVEKNYSDYTKALGIRTEPTLKEIAEGVMAPAVVAGLITNPLATVLGIAGFMAFDEAENYLISKVQGDSYKFQEGKNIADLLDMGTFNQPFIDTVEFVDFFAKGLAVHGVWKISPKIPELAKSFVKQSLETYNLPRNVYVSAEKIKSIFQTGDKISTEELNLVQSLGMSAKQYRDAILNGVTITIPVEKLITITDKPWWGKLKQLLGSGMAEPTAVSTLTGKPTVAPKLLPEPSGLPEIGPTRAVEPKSPTLAKPAIEPQSLPPARPIAPPSVAPIQPRSNTLADLNDYLTGKYGRTVEQATQTQSREALIETKTPIQGGVELISKFGSATRGFETQAFERQPDLLAGYDQGVLTDTFLLINEPSVTKSFINKRFEQNARKMQKQLNLTEQQVQELIAKDIENSKQRKFPDTKQITPKLKDTKPAVIQGVYAPTGVPLAILSDGTRQVAVNVDKLAFMQKNLPGSEIRITIGEEKPVVFVKDGKIKGLLMPIRTDSIPDFKGTSGYADKGVFKEDISAIPGKAPEGRKEIVPLEFPELVELERQISGGKTAEIKQKLRGALGRFYPATQQIKLLAILFKQGNERLLGFVMGHELGHEVGSLPGNTLKRGNILGHLFTLKKFFASTFVEGKSLNLEKLRNRATNEILAEQGKTLSEFISDKKIRDELKPLIAGRTNELIDASGAIREKTIRDELWNLSTYIRPLSEAPTKAELDYRKRPSELYADALSALFNTPGTLQQLAPTFYDKFFESLDKKPEVWDAYFALQDLMSETRETLNQDRLERIYRGYKEARAKREEIANKEKIKLGWLKEFSVNKLMLNHVSRFAPIYNRMKDFGQLGITVSPKEELRMTFEEMQMTRNDIWLFREQIDRDILQPLRELGVSEDEFGAILQLERASQGRINIANPQGLQKQYAEELLKFIGNKYDETTANVIKQITQRFHDIVFQYVEQLNALSVFKSDVFNEKILPFKDSYVTFGVVDYIEANYVPAGLKQQMGTLKDIENPLVTTMLKVISMVNLASHQKAKIEFITQWKELYPDEISKSEVKRLPTGQQIGFVDKPDTGRIELYENGVWVGYDTDPFIAEAFERYQPTDTHALLTITRGFNRVFKPIVTTYNLSWGLYSNIWRDTKRTVKNLRAITGAITPENKIGIGKFIIAWAKNIPESVRFQQGKLSEVTREMLESKAYSISFSSYDPYANENPVFEQIYQVEEPTVTGLRALGKAVVKPLIKILDGIKFTAGTLESNTKITGYQLLKERIADSRRVGFLTRNYVGTPNFFEGGTMKETDNNVFVFSNILIQGFRGDIELLKNPNTRGGAWLYTFLLDILPKLIMLGGVVGLFGQKIKDIYDKSTEYDKTNYTVIPLGEDENGKAVTWRIPHDEMGRLWAALTWKMGNAINGTLVKPQQTISIGVGLLPSVTPLFSMAGAWMNYIQGRNPYDSFYGRPVIDDLTWQAGGMPAFVDMLKWTTNNTGITQFASYDPARQSTTEYWLQKIPVLNRAIRISDYGKTEIYREIIADVESERAKELLHERSVINDLVDKAKNDPNSAAKYREQAVTDSLGHTPKTIEEIKEAQNIRTKFDLAYLRNTSNIFIDVLLNASTNEEKIHLLRRFRDELGTDEFNKLKQTVVENKVVNPYLFLQL